MRYVFGMEPASTIIRALGGPSRVAEIADVHRTRVHSWTRPREKGGTGGVVPHWHVRKLLEHAEREGIALSAASFAPVFAVPSTDLREAV